MTGNGARADFHHCLRQPENPPTFIQSGRIESPGLSAALSDRPNIVAELLCVRKAVQSVQGSIPSSHDRPKVLSLQRSYSPCFFLAQDPDRSVLPRSVSCGSSLRNFNVLGTYMSQVSPTVFHEVPAQKFSFDDWNDNRP